MRYNIEKVDAVKMSILQWQEIYWTGVLQACHVPYTVRSMSSPQPTSLFHFKSIREKDTYVPNNVSSYIQHISLVLQTSFI